PNPDATSYNVKRAEGAGGPFQRLGTVGGTNFVDNTVISNVVYRYVVSSANAFGEGTNSLEVSIKAGNVPPIANADFVTTAEDTPVDVDILGNDFEPNGDPFVVVSFTQPDNGVV